MCGRFALYAPASVIAEVFGVVPPEDVRPRYNIAPTSQVLGIRGGEEGRIADHYRWGLVPKWMARKGKRQGRPMINARSETAAEKNSFRYPMRHRRLLLPASGFYEWERRGDERLPYHFTFDEGGPCALAGLWERATLPDGEEIRSCTILTTQANDRVAPVHDRMPVILPPEAWDRWLDPELSDPEELQPLLRPYPTERTHRRRVSQRVNSSRNNDPGCLDDPD